MRHLKIFLKFILIIFVIIVFAMGCRDNYDLIDVEKLEAEELELLDRFYKSKLFEDSILSKALSIDGQGKDTLDLRKSIKLFSAVTYRSGYEDTASVGRVVGFRYDFYALDTDDNGEPALYLWFSNRTAHEPDYYTVGNVSSSTLSTCYGIDLAIRNMCLFDSCRIVIPSALGAQTMMNSPSFTVYDMYKTIVAYIEVSYLPRN
ncbi:MAG: hypothetical protein FWH18_05915 [Marinilabiliaceae bacterium]|nr:hypothetical protein [Marinilabiliaceae bacterium]